MCYGFGQTIVPLFQLPKPRQETKWEAYAKLKGIQNKKKDRLVWDKVHQVNKKHKYDCYITGLAYM